MKESFSISMVPTGSPSSHFPLNFIIPNEYLRPTITEKEVASVNFSKTHEVSSRNRFLQAIAKANVKLPLLLAKTETTALEDVERRDESATLCSAVSLQQYHREHPDSKLAILDVVDTLRVQIIVPRDSTIHTLDDLKQKVVACGLPGSASNRFVQELMRKKGWAQNRDLIIQEQIPDAIQLKTLMAERNRQIDAVILMDTHPSPIVSNIIDNEPGKWRFIPVSDMTPLCLVANASYPAREIMAFQSNIKNPYSMYNLQQVVKLYKIPPHPTSVHMYKSLG